MLSAFYKDSIIYVYMGDQNIVSSIGSILEKVLGSGLVLNGQIGINGLTVTSVDKAKELGIVPQQSQQSQQGSQSGSKESGQQESSDDQKGQQSGQKQSQGNQNSQDQQSQSGDQKISREEFDNMKEELSYMRKLMEQAQQQNSQEQQRGKQK
jgi:hypothetical protein